MNILNIYHCEGLGEAAIIEAENFVSVTYRMMQTGDQTSKYFITLSL